MNRNRASRIVMQKNRRENCQFAPIAHLNTYDFIIAVYFSKLRKNVARRRHEWRVRSTRCDKSVRNLHVTTIRLHHVFVCSAAPPLSESNSRQFRFLCCGALSNAQFRPRTGEAEPGTERDNGKMISSRETNKYSISIHSRRPTRTRCRVSGRTE